MDILPIQPGYSTPDESLRISASVDVGLAKPLSVVAWGEFHFGIMQQKALLFWGATLILHTTFLLKVLV